MASAEGEADRADTVQLARRLAEADRRLHGLMAVIGSVVRLSGELSDGHDPYVAHLEGRLGAIARAHGTVMGRPSGAIGLHGLVADELVAHAAIEDRNFSLDGPEIRLRGNAMRVLWLVVHELAVNSVKFGALSARDGTISVMWTLEVNQATHLLVRWTERRGPLVPSDRRPGFGTEMIEQRVARELGGSGSMEFTPTGLDCRISVPVGREVSVIEAA